MKSIQQGGPLERRNTIYLPGETLENKSLSLSLMKRKGERGTIIIPTLDQNRETWLSDQ